MAGLRLRINFTPEMRARGREFFLARVGGCGAPQRQQGGGNAV
jgi:hypothetical protein